MVKVKIKHHFGSFSNPFEKNQTHLIPQQTEISALSVAYIHIKNEIFDFVDLFIHEYFGGHFMRLIHNNNLS